MNAENVVVGEFHVPLLTAGQTLLRDPICIHVIKICPPNEKTLHLLDAIPLTPHARASADRYWPWRVVSVMQLLP
jgi:hypothetical protein